MIIQKKIHCNDPFCVEDKYKVIVYLNYLIINIHNYDNQTNKIKLFDRYFKIMIPDEDKTGLETILVNE